MSKEGVSIELPEELTMFTVEDFRNKIINKIANKTLKNLKATKLQLLDSAGIQLLLSLYKSFPDLIIQDLSENIIEDLQLMGIKEIFVSDRGVNDV